MIGKTIDQLTCKHFHSFVLVIRRISCSFQLGLRKLNWKINSNKPLLIFHNKTRTN
jgi:hypothetical protein